MKTSAAGLVALRVEVSLRESRMDIRALYAAVQVRPSRRPLCSRQNDDFTVSFGSNAADHLASFNDRMPRGSSRSIVDSRLRRAKALGVSDFRPNTSTCTNLEQFSRATRRYAICGGD